MSGKTVKRIYAILIAVFIGTSSGWAARKEAPAPQVPLTARGHLLEVKYTRQLEGLKAAITKALPRIDARKKSAYLAAREAEIAAEAARNLAKQEFGGIGRAQGLVNHATGKWIGGAEKGIEAAKEMLAKATTAAEREAAQNDLAKCEESKKAGLEALEERQANLDEALRKEPELKRALEAAEAALSRAQANTIEAIRELKLGSLLTSDKLDPQLVNCVVLLEATPRGLAEYAQQGKTEEALLEKLLADADLMKRMLLADGAAGGKYGQAMEIYTTIQKTSSRAGDGVLQRLALAVALEHATPIGQRNPKSDTDGPTHVDPLKRYQHFEKAYLDGELDPGFKDLSVWDYRMVVNGEEPEEILTWGREMLRNYRPDHISTPDYRWRYVAAVRTEVRYGSQCNQFDKPELHFFQNILMNGGVCGRRAFFGRFILRAFGIPTTARPQPGHAALVHWTPDGWVVCLGGGWGIGTTKGRYKKDRDFLANTQAREDDTGYVEVRRAQWIGDVLGERRVFGFLSGNPDFWYGLSLYRQKEIIEATKAVALAAVGVDIGEANETKEKVDVAQVSLTAEDKTIVVARDGTITVPATACTKPARSTGKIVFMDSILGGKQLHFSRTGSGLAECEYAIEAPKAGKYAVSARVVTPTGDQHLLISVNGAKDPVDMVLPLTVGMWDTSKPVEIALARGKNVLTFSRGGENIRGVTVRDFTLTPAR